MSAANGLKQLLAALHGNNVVFNTAILKLSLNPIGKLKHKYYKYENEFNSIVAVIPRVRDLCWISHLVFPSYEYMEGFTILDACRFHGIVNFVF